MKQTLTTYEVAHLLLKDKENNGFTYEGCFALAEYLEQWEQDLGEEIELDVVAIRCEWTEYASLAEAYEDYTQDRDDRSDEFISRYFEERTNLIKFEGEKKEQRIMLQQY